MKSDPYICQLLYIHVPYIYNRFDWQGNTQVRISGLVMREIYYKGVYRLHFSQCNQSFVLLVFSVAVGFHIPQTAESRKKDQNICMVPKLSIPFTSFRRI